jgi:hypothetical protein
MMDKKQKVLLVGGGLAAVAAILLISSTSKAASKVAPPPTKPNLPPAPDPSPNIDPHTKPPTPTPTTTTINSPFGKFVPCKNGICPEPYKSQILSAINASFDFYKLDQAESTYQQNGCTDLANAVRARYADLKGGLANLPEIGTVDSPCNYGGDMVQQNNDAAIRQWIDQLSDANLAETAAQALAQARPPCTSLAKYAKTKAENLRAAQQAAEGASESASNAVQTVGDTLSGWFGGE